MLHIEFASPIIINWSKSGTSPVAENIGLDANVEGLEANPFPTILMVNCELVLESIFIKANSPTNLGPRSQ